MRAIIIPNDPLKAYVRKGEIVPRYFNPRDIFDSIDFVSPDDSDILPDEVGNIAGRAKTSIHAAGQLSAKNVIFHEKYIKRIGDAIDPAGVDVIIAHNAHMAGYVGARLGKKYDIPVVIHLHTNLDKDVRAYLGWAQPSKKIFWSYSSLVLESYALKNASKIIAAYKFAAEYALDRSVARDRVEVVYHRIDIERFKVNRDHSAVGNGNDLKILCVGRIFDRKDPENIIRAVGRIKARLTIIGDGPYLEKMMAVSREMGIDHKVDFVRSVRNESIDRYYKEADIFASVNDYGGVSKPVMEAMASSLPIVIKKPVWEEAPELVKDVAVVTDGTAEGFERAFSSLSRDRERMISLGRQAFERLSGISGDAMEDKEAGIIMSIAGEKR